MSSLAATQADGYYIPPEYHNSGAYKKKSISQFNHPDHKGHNQYLKSSTVRFELPFDGFCTKCDGHVGKGTRYNAHKSHVDDYFTTKIYEFKTKCRQCASCEFVIRTNPKERTFDYVSGIRKKVEEFDTLEAGTAGVVTLETTTTSDGIGGSTTDRHVVAHSSATTTPGVGTTTSSALDGLNKTAHGERVALTERDALEALRSQSTITSLHDAETNSNLRSLYRKERRVRKRNAADAKALGLGRDISMGTLSTEDHGHVRKVFDQHGPVQIEKRDRDCRGKERDSFRKLRGGSIFGSEEEQRQRRRRKSKKARKTSDVATARELEEQDNDRTPSSMKLENVTGEEDVVVPDFVRSTCPSQQPLANRESDPERGGSSSAELKPDTVLSSSSGVECTIIPRPSQMPKDTVTDEMGLTIKRVSEARQLSTAAETGTDPCSTSSRTTEVGDPRETGKTAALLGLLDYGSSSDDSD